MTDSSHDPAGAGNSPRVYTDDIPSRPAPIFEVGALAWVRQNLFKTWLDVFLTLTGGFLAVTVVVGLVAWSVSSANWWSIEFNLNQFLVGRYEAAFEWRLQVAALVTTFVAGAAVAIWIRQISQVALYTVIGLLILLFVVPSIIISTTALPPSYIAVANTPVEVSTASELPPQMVAFLGREGETVTLTRVQERISDDERLGTLSGFMDSTTNLLRNTANGRLSNIALQAELEAELARDRESTIPLFTENQRQQRQAQLNALQISDPTVEQFGVGQPAVVVEILNRALEPIAPAVTLDTPDRMAVFDLPADGWYVLRRTLAEGDEGVAVLSVTGIYPILRSTALATGEDGGATTGFASTYIRMTDNYRLQGLLPRIDGEDLLFYNVVNNQFRGARSFDAYLRVYLAPFLQKVSFGTSLLLLMGVAGYWVARAGTSIFGSATATSWTGRALVLTPLFIWIMAAGLTPQEILNLLGVGAALTFILFIYQAAAYWGRNLITLQLYVAGALALTLLPRWIFGDGNSYGFGLLALINASVFLTAGVALLMGSSLFTGTRETDNRNRLIVYGVLTVILAAIPLALVNLGGVDPSIRYTDWFLAASDQRRWGGLLLTMVLTIFGIIVAFPIGVGLALGRRSNLPAIKYGCTAYIELVRGSPFITVLFMMQLMIPLINPSFAEIPGTIRALVAVIMFSAAYLAENVRGGLQSLPPGQEEAARALGMSGFQIVMQITLPQALRAVIPALVGQFIALFKDTSLVAIVGLTDLTGYVNIMAVQAEFIGTRAEGLLFITLIYFVFSYVMSYISRLLEASGSGSTRKM